MDTKNLEMVKENLKKAVYIRVFMSPIDEKRYRDKEYIPLKRILFLVINKLGRGYEIRLITPTKIEGGKIIGTKILKHQCTHPVKDLSSSLKIDKSFEGDLITAQEKITSVGLNGNFEKLQLPEKFYRVDNTGEIIEVTTATRDCLVKRKDIIFKNYVITRSCAKENHLLHRIWDNRIYRLLVKA